MVHCRYEATGYDLRATGHLRSMGLARLGSRLFGGLPVPEGRSDNVGKVAAPDAYSAWEVLEVLTAVYSPSVDSSFVTNSNAASWLGSGTYSAMIVLIMFGHTCLCVTVSGILQRPASHFRRLAA